MNLWTIFITGLFVGGLTCLAVQGGLLAATIAQREQDKLKEQTKRAATVFPILSFIVAKVIVYTIFGFLLGWLGSVLQLSLSTKIILQFAVIIFMIGTALNILNVHPIFRYFAIQPPRFITKKIRNQSKSKDIFAPALLGAFTIFIPCGTTQAMMALAIGSGNPIMGAAIMASFTLGTAPLFFILGYTAAKLGDVMRAAFMKFAAGAIIILALFNLNATMALTGSRLTVEDIAIRINCEISFCAEEPISVGQAVYTAAPDTNPTITFTDAGYVPKVLNIKAGSSVTLRLINTNGAGCIQAFNIPTLNIEKVVTMGKADTVQFTAPTQKGPLAFMCSMGMIRGNFNVI